MRQYLAFDNKLPEDISSQLIIVNDGSPNDVSQGRKVIEEALNEKVKWVVYEQNMGKGYALRQGVKQSEADYIILTDHDFPYTYESMLEILGTMHIHKQEVVIGHRDKNYYKDLPFLRVKLSHYLKTINRFILRLNTDDTQCGLKGFRQSVKPTFLSTKTNRFLIDIEFLRRAKKAGKGIEVIDVQSRENVVMSTLAIRTILSELFSYVKIFVTT